MPTGNTKQFAIESKKIKMTELTNGNLKFIWVSITLINCDSIRSLPNKLSIFILSLMVSCIHWKIIPYRDNNILKVFPLFIKQTVEVFNPFSLWNQYKHPTTNPRASPWDSYVQTRNKRAVSEISGQENNGGEQYIYIKG